MLLPKYPNDMLSIIKNGLPNIKKRKKNVLIAGAGMAGLVSASLLKQAGHTVTVLEGNNRIGGRIYTLRSPFTNGNYLNMGAMRIPHTHKLVLKYIEKFQLPLSPFINSHPNDIIYINNRKISRKQYEENPNLLDFHLNKNEQGKTAFTLLQDAVEPFITLYNNSTEEEKKKMVSEYDKYSMVDFLKYNPLATPLSSNAIRLISILLGIEGFQELSFMSILSSVLSPLFQPDIKYFEIRGGNDRLPYSFQMELASNLFYNQKIESIKQGSNKVNIYVHDTYQHTFKTYTGDYCLITLPFTTLQFIDLLPKNSISQKKWQAIRELQNISSMKIGIEFSSPFWERYNFGHVITDLPIRFSYIPSRVNNDAPAVLLASYSWGSDALLWNSLSQSDITREVLKCLSEVYGNIVYKEYLRTVTFNWSRNSFSAGCFTLYAPGQQKHFGEEVSKPSGRLHFAGEHASLFPGWIEGAIESGIRAAAEIHMRE